MAVKISMEHFLSSCGHDENANSLTEEQVNQVAKMTKCSSYVVEYLFNVIEELDYEVSVKLEDTEKGLKLRLSSLEKEESDLAKKLSNKYGKGSIDLNSGTFTPIE